MKDKYDSMDEGDKYEIGEEICVRNCWQGFHKWFPNMKDKELIGVDVKKLTKISKIVRMK